MTKQQEKQAPEAVKPKSKIQLKGPVNKFINDLASLSYYEKYGTDVKFEQLAEDVRESYIVDCLAMIVALDKLGKEITDKGKSVQEKSLSHEQKVSRIAAEVKKFLGTVDTIKCGQCGKKQDVKLGLFPSDELAHKLAEVL